METKDGLRAHVERALEATGETRCLELGCGVLAKTPEVFAGQFGDKPALVVADETTFAVAGRAVVEAFRRARRAVGGTIHIQGPETLCRKPVRGGPGGGLAGAAGGRPRCGRVGDDRTI